MLKEVTHLDDDYKRCAVLHSLCLSHMVAWRNIASQVAAYHLGVIDEMDLIDKVSFRRLRRVG